MSDEIKDAIVENAVAGIKRARGDEGEVEALPIDDQIKADRYVKGQTAATKPARGLRFTKMIMPGATS